VLTWWEGPIETAGYGGRLRDPRQLYVGAEVVEARELRERLQPEDSLEQTASCDSESPEIVVANPLPR